MAATATTASFSTLRDFGRAVMLSTDPVRKAALTFEAHRLFARPAVLNMATELGSAGAIDVPGVPEGVAILPPAKMKGRKGGSPAARAALVHALTHIENRAIELAWDLILREWHVTEPLPAEFYQDWLQVAEDEARHYTRLNERLTDEYKTFYGALPAHGGLWTDALRTKDQLEARLVLEHCVHEAKGLDVTRLVTIGKFRDNGDAVTADLLEHVVLPEEITHVACGLKWFKKLQRVAPAAPHTASLAGGTGGDTSGGSDDESATVRRFWALVGEFYHGGSVRGPFNDSARHAAGMTDAYYRPNML